MKLCEQVICRPYIRLTEEGTVIMNEVFEQIEQQFQERVNNLDDTELKEIEMAIHTLQKKLF